MAAKTRVYLVSVADKPRLVRASHPSHALMHVARDLAVVAVASQDDLIVLLAKGVPVEAIAAEQQELPET